MCIHKSDTRSAGCSYTMTTYIAGHSLDKPFTLIRIGNKKMHLPVIKMGEILIYFWP